MMMFNTICQLLFRYMSRLHPVYGYLAIFILYNNASPRGLTSLTC